MSRAEDYLTAIQSRTFDQDSRPVADLLLAIAKAWFDADAGIPSETEANRWSPVCNAAERVVGL